MSRAAGSRGPGGPPARRVAPPRRGKAGGPTRPARQQWLRAAGLAAAAAAVILALYLAHPIVSGYRFPVGPDGPVYTWLARYVGTAGFGDTPGGGPGVPGLTLFLGATLLTEPVETVTILGPVLAAVCGLAGAALLETLLGASAPPALAAAMLTGGFTAYLAGGWLANLAMVAVFLAAIAALGLAHRSWRAAALGGALIAAAGLAHRLFLLIGLLIVAGTIVWRWREARGARRVTEAAPFRMAVATVGGAALALGGIAWIAGPAIPGDTSQDGFFRRLGLRELLLDRYRERFVGDAARASVPIAAGIVLGAVALSESGRRSTPEARHLIATCVSWAVVTAGGIVLLALTGWGPPNRMLQFAFFLPIAAAAGLAGLARRGASAAALVAGIAFVTFSMVGWFRQSPAVSAEELALVSGTVPVIDRLAPGTPLVFVVDTSELAAAYHATRFGNVIRMAVPAERIPDVRLAVGRPEDALAGRPTRTGDVEHDRISEAYARENRPLLERAIVFVLRPFNPEGYEAVRAEGTEVASDVVTLSGIQPITAAAGSPGPSPGLGPLALVALSGAAVAILGVLGGGWARWGLPAVGPRAVAVAAPSAGVAVAILGTVAADRLGWPPGGTGSLVVVSSIAALGYLAAARRGGTG